MTTALSAESTSVRVNIFVTRSLNLVAAILASEKLKLARVSLSSAGGFAVFHLEDPDHQGPELERLFVTHKLRVDARDLFDHRAQLLDQITTLRQGERK